MEKGYSVRLGMRSLRQCVSRQVLDATSVGAAESIQASHLSRWADVMRTSSVCNPPYRLRMVPTGSGRRLVSQQRKL